MAEALARCPPADAIEHEQLVGLLAAIEDGAITGAHRGAESLKERQQEEGEDG